MKKNKTSILLLIGLMVVLIAGTAVTIQANTSGQPAAGDQHQMQCSQDECPSDKPCASGEQCTGEKAGECGSKQCNPGC